MNPIKIFVFKHWLETAKILGVLVCILLFGWSLIYLHTRFGLFVKPKQEVTTEELQIKMDSLILIYNQSKKKDSMYIQLLQYQIQTENYHREKLQIQYDSLLHLRIKGPKKLPLK